MSERVHKRPALTPANWPAWLGVVLIWLTGKLPQILGIWLSAPLGRLLSRLMGRRRRIAQRNIERCFPELGPGEREAILRNSFRSLARAIFEISWAWSASDRRIRSMGSVEGLEHLENARKGGKGVLIITAHVSCIEIGGRLFGQAVEAGGIYRPLKNPVLEWFQNRARSRYATKMISKRDMRTAVRSLLAGDVLWTAPDQDFGVRQSMFAPFFGIQTATLLATPRMARLARCPVVPMFPSYDEKTRRYTVRILPALEHFPSEDPVHDLGRINRVMEKQVRSAPGQYWWIHRRFKTRPQGERDFYQ
jgi:KDO2-lipid IV(A) lauroyltransferase